MQTDNANESPRCNHIRDHGRQCGSPALRDHAFCYYHERIHHPMAHPRKNPVAFIPPLESVEAISIAVTNIVRSVGAGHLDYRHARTMISALRLMPWAFRFACDYGESVTDVPQPMTNVLTLAHTDVEPDATQSLTPSENERPSSVILSEDERPSEGPHHRTPQPKRPRPSNILPADLSVPLNEEQIAYCRSVLRYGPAHPHFHDCSRRVDKLISSGVA